MIGSSLIAWFRRPRECEAEEAIIAVARARQNLRDAVDARIDDTLSQMTTPPARKVD